MLTLGELNECLLFLPGALKWYRVPMRFEEGCVLHPSRGGLYPRGQYLFIYLLCVLYMDGILVSGENEDEFADDCRTIVTRLGKNHATTTYDKMFLKPSTQSLFSGREEWRSW